MKIIDVAIGSANEDFETDNFNKFSWNSSGFSHGL